MRRKCIGETVKKNIFQVGVSGGKCVCKWMKAQEGILTNVLYILFVIACILFLLREAFLRLYNTIPVPIIGCLMHSTNSIILCWMYGAIR